MITVKNNVFQLDTPNTSYVFCVRNEHLESLHYGGKVSFITDQTPHLEKLGTGMGTSVCYSTKYPNYVLDNICLETSSVGKGDYREPMIELIKEDGTLISDFLYSSYEIVDKISLPLLPSSYGEGKTLCITLVDASNIKLHLYYSVFDNSDAIVKSCRVENLSGQTVKIKKLMSSQLDLPDCDFNLLSLDGAWIRERYVNTRPLVSGITIIDSKTGISSNRHNPYICLYKKNATLFDGDCYGFNLIYSGNHIEVVEVSPFNKTRVLNGINPHCFEWSLNQNEEFYSPEEVLTFSDKGLNGLTKVNHQFVKEHIIRGKFKNKVRPILINNWEATYFDFNEKKLLELAKESSDIGIELFVLDDGWFGNRKDDSIALGDWTVNTKKLPSSLKGLASKINKMGMEFGIWVEPEMVNVDSELYRNHSDWAIKHPDYTPSFGRNQLILNYTIKEVREYIIDSMSKIFSGANISYVKWDFNRTFSDIFSINLQTRQGEFFHRYILGLYEVLDALTQKFPNILFESCASGGNRVDLAMLCYMPQFWTSDNTDSYDRMLIQEGTLLAYPQCSMGAHVSASPNHQTLRQSFTESRFNTAAIGLLGYELDITKLPPNDIKAIKNQIAFYKQHRDTLQFGVYQRLKDVFTDNNACWIVSSIDNEHAVAGLYNKISPTNPMTETLKTKYLDDNILYDFSTRQQSFNVKFLGDLINRVLPITIKENGFIHNILADNYTLKSELENYILQGDILNKIGVKLYPQFQGTGYSEELRVLCDFGSRLYTIDKHEEPQKKQR